MSQAKWKHKSRRIKVDAAEAFVRDRRVFSLPFVNPMGRPELNPEKPFREWWSAPYREYEHEGRPIGTAYFLEWAKLAKANRGHAAQALRFALERMVTKGRLLSVESSFIEHLAAAAAAGAN